MGVSFLSLWSRIRLGGGYMEFNYYYETGAEQFSFIRITKVLLLNKTFSTLSLQAKMLYGILLDRMGYP